MVNEQWLVEKASSGIWKKANPVRQLAVYLWKVLKAWARGGCCGEWGRCKSTDPLKKDIVKVGGGYLFWL